MSRNSRRERRRYDTIPSQENLIEETDEEEAVTPPPGRQYSHVSEEDSSVATKSEIEETDNEDVDISAEKDAFNVTILDFAQAKFQVLALPSWTVLRFKKAGAKIHKVAPARQRLIYRGKMLGDEEKTLEDYGIAEEGVIVHLFPKPRVVITNREEENTDEEESEDGGARVPTIVMDADEAGRRAEILVLGSTEFMEAQNNVKLFSFMLLIISSIELLNLFAIAMGVPQDSPSEEGGGIPVQENEYGMQSPEEDSFDMMMGNHTHTAESEDPAAVLYSHFGPAQYADTAVSMIGVYVAILGLQASTENTLRRARAYFFGLVLAGCSWLLFNFFFTAAIERKIDEHDDEMNEDGNYVPATEEDLYNQAFQVMILPAMVWLMCWARAWHFQSLLYDAETEANERIQAQLDLEEERDQVATTPTADEELAISNQNAVFT